jgi:hypothetical protein
MTGYFPIDDAYINAQFNDITTLMSRQGEALNELHQQTNGTNLLVDVLQQRLDPEQSITPPGCTGPPGCIGEVGVQGGVGEVGAPGCTESANPCSVNYGTLSGRCLINHRIRQLHEVVLRQNLDIEKLKAKMTNNKDKLAKVVTLQAQKLDKLTADNLLLTQRKQNTSELEIALESLQEQVDMLTKQVKKKDEQLTKQTRQIVDLEFERNAFKEYAISRG